MTDIYITAYSAICNLGSSIDEIFHTALKGENLFFSFDNTIIENVSFPFGKISKALPLINNDKYNLRCNRILLHCVNNLKNKIDKLLKNYDKSKIGIVIGNTNSGVDEFEKSKDIDHSQIGNPAGFLHNYLGLKGYYSGVSTACTSGIKAFSTAQKLLDANICDVVICAAVDALSRMPIFGFHSLEVLSPYPCIPFSKNRNGINIGEGGALFIIEKNQMPNSIKIMGIGETSDAYHSATPEPEGIQASRAMKQALEQSGLKACEIDYINMHGTGTLSNDIMEANAISRIFKNNIPVSSTKSLTGHCLGASAAVEAALCCATLDKKLNPEYYLLPHIYDSEYDTSLPVLNLVSKNQKTRKLKYCMNNAFGFGGSNASIILGRTDE
ncbi:MAG: hypothetical protein KHX03_01625 [Clostridium sp.]|nr:hypothetical protein [Clostridium sp.]